MTSEEQFNFIADIVSPHVSWPSRLHDIADALEIADPSFDKVKFLRRATSAWESNNLVSMGQLSDEIPY